MRIQKEIENVERVKDKIATMPLTMEDAIEFHKQVVDRVEKERKEINKELDLDSDIEEKGFTGASKEPKKVSTPELKKMKLAESLFENTLNESFKPSKGFISYLLQELDNSLDEDRLYDFFETLLDDFDMSAADIYNYMYFLNKTGDLEFISEIILDINNIEHDIVPMSEMPESTGPMLIIFDDDENYKQITNQAIKVLKKYKINAKLVQYNDEEAYGVIALNGILNSKVSESLNEEINLNDYDDGYVELRDGKPRFVYSTLRDAKDGMFWSQMGDNEHSLGNHTYEIKKWENGELKDLDESLNECDKFKKGDCKNYALDEAKISRQNQRRKKDAYLQRKEAEREKAEKEARERERIGDAAWGEKDWIAEREKGDLDFSNYSDEERAEIEKRLKAFDNNKTAQAQYQRRKEAEEAKRAEEERKKAEQEKEERTKKRIERIGKLANAPKDIGNAFKKGLGIG